MNMTWHDIKTKLIFFSCLLVDVHITDMAIMSLVWTGPMFSRRQEDAEFVPSWSDVRALIVNKIWNSNETTAKTILNVS